jgi:hypothetical protein
MRRALVVCLLWLLTLGSACAQTQAKAALKADDPTAKNAQQARAVLDAMVVALGGDGWVQMKNRELDGTTAAFYHGKPSSGTTPYWEFHVWPATTGSRSQSIATTCRYLLGARDGK